MSNQPAENGQNVSGVSEAEPTQEILYRCPFGCGYEFTIKILANVSPGDSYQMQGNAQDIFEIHVKGCELRPNISPHNVSPEAGSDGLVW